MIFCIQKLLFYSSICVKTRLNTTEMSFLGRLAAQTYICFKITERLPKEIEDEEPALLQHQDFNFLFYLGWAGCFTQSKHNIMKVVQS